MVRFGMAAILSNLLFDIKNESIDEILIMLCISIPINERRYELHISQRLREEVKFVNQLIVFTFVE